MSHGNVAAARSPPWACPHAETLAQSPWPCGDPRASEQPSSCGRGAETSVSEGAPAGEWGAAGQFPRTPTDERGRVCCAPSAWGQTEWLSGPAVGRAQGLCAAPWSALQQPVPFPRVTVGPCWELQDRDARWACQAAPLGSPREVLGAPAPAPQGLGGRRPAAPAGVGVTGRPCRVCVWTTLPGKMPPTSSAQTVRGKVFCCNYLIQIFLAYI